MRMLWRTAAAAAGLKPAAPHVASISIATVTQAASPATTCSPDPCHWHFPPPSSSPLQTGLGPFAPFDPLNMRSDETRLKELKNGRLAMVSGSLGGDRHVGNVAFYPCAIYVGLMQIFARYHFAVRHRGCYAAANLPRCCCCLPLRRRAGCVPRLQQPGSGAGPGPH